MVLDSDENDVICDGVNDAFLDIFFQIHDIWIFELVVMKKMKMTSLMKNLRKMK